VQQTKARKTIEGARGDLSATGKRTPAKTVFPGEAHTGQQKPRINEEAKAEEKRFFVLFLLVLLIKQLKFERQ